MRNEIAEVRQVKSQVEDLAKSQISSLVARKAELTELKEQFKEKLEENEEYQKACAIIKDAQKQKTAAKKRAMQNPELIKLDQEIRDKAFDMKETQTTLFELLLQYNQETGNREIVDNTGLNHPIEIKAKIKL